MNSIRIFALLLAALSGCQQKDTVESKPVVKAVETKPQVDQKYVDCKNGVKKYIAEAISVTKAMDQFPSMNVLKGRVEELEKLFTRIPDPPSGNAVAASWVAIGKEFNFNFGQAVFYQKAIIEYTRLEDKNNAKKCMDIYILLGNTQRKLLTRFDELVDSNMPANFNFNIEFAELKKLLR